jgi:quercetin dioxygenase-like cupin family protein
MAVSERPEVHGHGARRGEPVATGSQWWPNEADRLVALLEAGSPLTSDERFHAQREIENRQRREQSPAVIRRESIVFEQSSYRGVEIGHIVSPDRGIETRHMTLSVHRLLPGATTDTQTHGEAVYHVLSGTGTSIIDGGEHAWGPHDSMHIQAGAWYQHRNASADLPAYLLAARPTPIIEHLSEYAYVSKGDSFTDAPDEYQPEHPFTRRRVDVAYVGGEKWMSQLQLATHQRVEERERLRREARVILRADEAVIERSEHRGDWKVGLVDRYLGFDNRILAMYVHQMPPASHTETHKHGEAIVYVLSGRGYSIVDGARFEWQAGDCIHVHPGQWHQHFNTDPERVSQHIALYTQPLTEHIGGGQGLVQTMSDSDYQPSAYDGRDDEWWS